MLLRLLVKPLVGRSRYPTDPQLGHGAAWNPSGLANHVKAARASVPDTPFYLTEYNVGCCIGYTGHDTSASAAFAFRTIPALDGIVDILSWWTFTDVFEEGGLPTKEYSNIYGLMTYHGVPKPGWRGFQLLNGAGDHRIPATLPSDMDTLYVSQSQRVVSGDCVTDEQTNMAGFTLSSVKADTPAYCCAKCQAVGQQECSFWTFYNGTCEFKSSDAGRTTAPGYVSGSRVVPGNSNSSMGSPLSVFATINGTEPGVASLQVFLSLWANPSDPSAVKNRTVKVTVKHAAGAAPKAVVAWRIDESHGNSLAAWEAMGSPAVPSSAQLSSLIKASQIVPEPVTHTSDGEATVVEVPMTGDSAVRLNFS